MTDSPRPCDPGPLDDLVCQAKGVEAQAQYNKEHETELTEARTAFGQARSAYGAARHEAERALAPGRTQLEAIFADRCTIDQAQRRRLDRAFKRVRVRLDACRPEPCCVDCECDWDDEVGRCEEPDDVAALIARINWHIERATRCFADLLDETRPAPPLPPTPAPPAPASAATPTTEPPATSADGLAARVARVLAEIKNLEEHAATWPATRTYAAALVAHWHVRTVCNGFDDVTEYVDCLCRALTCMIKGHTAIARLSRRAAVAKCHRDTWDAACAALDAQAVDEVLAEYLRLCADGDDRDHDGPPDGDKGGDGGVGYGGGHHDGGHGGGHDDGGHGEPRGHEPPRPAPAEPGRGRPYPEPPQPPDGGYSSEGEDDRPPYSPDDDTPPDEPEGPGPRGPKPRYRPPYRDSRGRYRSP